MKTLTTRQRILKFIRDFQGDKGYPPTVRDIVAGCRMSSTSVAAYHIEVLEKEGYLRRHPDISRGIELLDKPRTFQVPLLGNIAAGKPIPVPAADTWDNVANAETISVPGEIIRAKEGVYALKVKGSSMVDALISDGDTVLMQHANSVENGEMAAVWLKAEKEVTLKKFYAESGRIRLQPANRQMKPIYTDPDNVEVQGKVIGVIRQVG